jgi:hypothetical protein
MVLLSQVTSWLFLFSIVYSKSISGIVFGTFYNFLPQATVSQRCFWQSEKCFSSHFYSSWPVDLHINITSGVGPYTEKKEKYITCRYFHVVKLGSETATSKYVHTIKTILLTIFLYCQVCGETWKRVAELGFQ